MRPSPALRTNGSTPFDELRTNGYTPFDKLRTNGCTLTVITSIPYPFMLSLSKHEKSEVNGYSHHPFVLSPSKHVYVNHAELVEA